MNYFLKLNEKSPFGPDMPRYHMSCGGHTPNVTHAWTSTSLKEAKRVRRHTFTRAIIVEMSDKEVFKARLKGL